MFWQILSLCGVISILTLLGTAILLWHKNIRANHLQSGQLQQLTTALEHRFTEQMTHQLSQQREHALEMNRLLGEELKTVYQYVEKRLTEGFEKTNATFTDIATRLAVIDNAQKKLTELSTNVVSLQEILSDKRSRGAFGEVQLSLLIQNMLPAEHYSFQHSLSNGLRADCVLFLPPPTGNIAVDAKFPLEQYQQMTNFDLPDTERKQAQQIFKQVIKKHITDIQSKYIIAGETSEGAIMFVPAEAVFAEIHARFPDLVEFAQRASVWITSPTTLMAVLTTVKAVLKDSATKEHIHIIQDHLRMLAQDFTRFETRLTQLGKHIDKANQDVTQVQISAKKITQRFQQIEKTEIKELNNDANDVVVASPELIASSE